MWQKCPVCNGTGECNIIHPPSCKTCDGKGIISSLTGKPPTGLGSKDYQNLDVVEKCKHESIEEIQGGQIERCRTCGKTWGG